MASQENIAYARLSLVLKCCGKDVVDALLMKMVSDLRPINLQPEDDWTLDHLLYDKTATIHSCFDDRKQEDKKKKMILLPGHSRNTNLCSWDLQLVVWVLKCICNLKERQSLIYQDVKNIGNIRNKISHLAEPSLREDIYDNYLSRLEGAYSRILKFVNNDELKGKVFGQMELYKKETIGMDLLNEMIAWNRETKGALEGLSADIADLDRKVMGKLDNVEEDQKRMNRMIQEIWNWNKEKIERQNGACWSGRIPGTKAKIKFEDVEPKAVEAVSKLLAHAIQTAKKQKIGDLSDDELEIVLQKCLEELLTDGREITDTSVECVAIYIQCQTIESLMALFDDCISGRLTSIFKPLQFHLRKTPGYENIELKVVVDKVDYLACVTEIYNQLEECYSAELEQAERLAMSDNPLSRIQVESSDIVQCENSIEMEFTVNSASFADKQKFEESVLSGSKQHAFDKLAEVLRERFDSPKLQINLQLDSDISSNNSCIKGPIHADETHLESEPMDSTDGAQGDGTMEPVMYDSLHPASNNDHNVAPQLPSTSEPTSVMSVHHQMSSESQKSNISIDSEINLKKLNIKPDMQKIVSVNSDDENDSDDETNSMASENDGSDMENDDDTSASARPTHTDTQLVLRGYQLELAEDAIQGRNTIICSETGTGKTWVALHIVKKHLSEACKTPRKVAFMARTGLLIKQQANRFLKHLSQFNTKLLTGEDDDSLTMDAFISRYDILCFTPQILVNNLDMGNVKSLSSFSLLILDECHHIMGDNPYARLMRKYLVEKEYGDKDMPQVVGLTASIGVGSSRTDEEAVNYILRICACLDTRILSTVDRNRTELEKYITVPKEEIIKMVIKRPDPCRDTIIEAMEEIEHTLQDLVRTQPYLMGIKLMQPEDKECHEYNKWTVEMIKAAQLNVMDHDTSRNIGACAMHLYVYNSALEVNNILQIKDIMQYLATKQRLESENKVNFTAEETVLFKQLQDVQERLSKVSRGTDNENPNVRMVSKQLKQMLQEQKGDDSRAIVFVKARGTCRILAEFLDKDLQNCGVRASTLYGNDARAGDEGMTWSQQTDILEKFKNGGYKVIVCTYVETEGIDVPYCNIVININYSGDEITKIQMKGRSRKKEGTRVMFGNKMQLEQEMVNAYKAAMMYRAMKAFKHLDPNNVSYKVTLFQKNEMQKYLYQSAYESAMKYRQCDDNFEILCRRCGTRACYVTDVRRLGYDHLVIDTEFPNKITTKPHKTPKFYDGIEKKAKMYCKKCPMDWGMVAERDGTYLRILKLISFKFRNMRTGVLTTYKKWIDMPYHVPEMQVEDIPKFLDYENDSGDENDSGNEDENDSGNENDSSNETNSMASENDGSDIETDYATSASNRAKHTDTQLVLREYQLELAEDAIQGRNTIICSETGTGKTWVALYIVKKHMAEACKTPRKVAFMARTGLLIKQQANRFLKYLSQFNTKLLTEEDDDSRIMDAFISSYDIFCFTPQILVHNLATGNAKSLSSFSLLILDECHHTKGDSPYARLMRRYLFENEQGVKDMPQVVGLTASIGVGNSRTDEEAVNYILRICACLDTRNLSTVDTCRNRTELEKYITVPKEEIIKMVIKRPDPCRDTIIEAMEEIEETLQDLVLMQPDLIGLMVKQPKDKECQEYNRWTVEMIKAAQLNVRDHDTSRNIGACAMHLNVYNAALEVNNLLQMKDIMKYLATEHRLESESKAKLTAEETTLFKQLQDVQKRLSKISRGTDNENPNVRMVSKQLKQMLQEKKGDGSRAIVYVKARETCRALAEFLDKDLLNCGVRASPLYGKDARAGDEGMTGSQQRDILEKFENGFYKVIVCTSVGTEGIDVPYCNIVINYNYSGDEITKIQMKGRSRKKEGTHVMFGNKMQVEQEMVNVYKAAMMYRAMKTFKDLDPKDVNYKVRLFQKEEMQNHRCKSEYESAIKIYCQCDDNFEILCRRCSTQACYVTDVRRLGHDHLVIDTEFPNKITTKPHKKPMLYDGIETKAKMYCKKCPMDWGIVAERDGTDLWILKIINFKFRNMRTGHITTYKKWIDMPYNVPEMQVDIPKFLDVDEKQAVVDADIDLREYQKELAKEGCCGKNVIVMAPTNSGKTRTACHIMQVHLRRKAAKGQLGKVIFLVENEALAFQQGEVCAELLPAYRTEVFSGSVHRDKKQFLCDFMDSRDILVMTAQVLLNALKNKEIDSLTRFSMIVFDECHHTNNLHRYKEIMSLYMDLKLKDKLDAAALPQIVGLTASLGVGGKTKWEEAVDHMKGLLANHDARFLCTVRRNVEELKQYTNSPVEELVPVRGRDRDEFEAAIVRIKDQINDFMLQHASVHNLPKQDQGILQFCQVPASFGSEQFRQWLSNFKKALAMVRQDEVRRMLNPCRIHLEAYNQALLVHHDARISDAQGILKTFITGHRPAGDDTDEFLLDLYNDFSQISFKAEPENPKLTKLQEIILNILGNNENARGIMFVKTRELAKALINWMKETDVLKKMNATEFVGQTASATQGGMTKRLRKDVLKYFKGGWHKIIVATSVAEEGLDISKCNLVIRYEHVTNEIVRLQSRGRARAGVSHYYVVSLAGSWILAKEEKNAMLERLMLQIVPHLQAYIEGHQNLWEREILKLQDEQKALEDSKAEQHQQMRAGGPFEIQCLNCSTPICTTEDIRRIQGAHHVIIDENCQERLLSIRDPHPRFAEEELKFDGEIRCVQENCLSVLGGVCEYKHTEFPLLKMKYLRIVGRDGRNGETFKQWKKANLPIQDFTLEDLREVVERRKAQL